MEIHDKHWTPILPGTGLLNVDLMVVGATAMEMAWAVQAPLNTKQLPLWRAVRLEGVKAALVITGPGPINAALAMGAALARVHADVVLNVGVGGAYPGADLEVGDLAVASDEIDADTGVEPVEQGELPTPIRVGRTSRRYPVCPKNTSLLFEAASQAGNAVMGSFVTSATVTASRVRAERLRERHNVICENMEGAAVASAALAADVSFVELRGISNMVGPRDLSAWKMAAATEVVGEAAKGYIRMLAERIYG